MFKRCMQCGAEYQRTVERCGDCGGPLEYSIDATPLEPARVASELPPSAQLACLRVDHPMWMGELAEALQRAGITSRVDAFPPGGSLSRNTRSETTRVGLYVREADLEAARRVDHEVFSRRTPDAPPFGAASEASTCPACGVALAADATECASCGLAFPES